MRGFFDDNGRPKVRFRVEGTRNSGEIEALFDTGFSGSLALPPQHLIAVGAELVGIEPMTYADGRTSNELLFRIKVYIRDEPKTIEAHLIPGAGEPIAGVQLFDPYVILIHFAKKELDVVLAEVYEKLKENIGEDE